MVPSSTSGRSRRTDRNRRLTDGGPRADLVDNGCRVGHREADFCPIIGGMVTSTIHVLVITPVIFYLRKTRALRRGTLRTLGCIRGVLRVV